MKNSVDDKKYVAVIAGLISILAIMAAVVAWLLVGFYKSESLCKESGGTYIRASKSYVCIKLIKNKT